MDRDGYEIEHDSGGWWATCATCDDRSDTADFRDQAQQWGDTHTCPDDQQDRQ